MDELNCPSKRALLFLGDSVTWQPGGWAYRVTAVAGGRSTNLARPGSVAREVRATQTAVEVSEHDVAFLYVGTNDVVRRENLAVFEVSVAEIAEWMVGRSQRCAVLTIPLSLFPFRVGIKRRILAANAALRRVASTYELGVVELENQPSTGFWSADRMHPSSRGHALMANKALEHLRLDVRVNVPAVHRRPIIRTFAIGLRHPLRAAIKIVGIVRT